APVVGRRFRAGVGGRVGPGGHGVQQGDLAARPGGADGAQHDATVVVGRVGRRAVHQPYFEVVVGQHRQDRIAPLDEHDTTVVEQLGQAQFGHLGQLVESVDVEVVDGQAAGVLLGERE